jgi:hypothetical protein
MAADLSLLVPEFRDKVALVRAECSGAGFELRPFFTLRDPWTQARLWRQSRSTEQIKAAHARLVAKGAPWIAEVLMTAGPASGKWATNALPGQSWHQFGEALDCFVVGPTGAAIWDAAHPGYKVYAERAQARGLTAGYFWKGASDSVHIQLRPESSPLHTLSWQHIDAAMKEKFNG